MKDQIEMFSLQIAHKRVKFSAAGLFPIDYTLLFSVGTNSLHKLFLTKIILFVDHWRSNNKFSYTNTIFPVNSTG